MNRIVKSTALIFSLALMGTSSPVENLEETSANQSDEGSIRRLTYTIKLYTKVTPGVPVARAVFDEVQPAVPGNEWTVRVAARTTSFWDNFTRIYNTYTTSFSIPGFSPSRYLRQIDQTGLRFDRLEVYGRQAGSSSFSSRLPQVPARYLAGGESVELENVAVPAGYGNFFSALWYVRHADWDRMQEVTLPLWLEGQKWRTHIRKVGVESRKAPEGRVQTWKLICTLSRETGDSDTDRQAGSVSDLDHLTKNLMKENQKLTLWIEQSGLRRPISVKASAGIFSLVGQLRSPFEGEILK
jgi:hypothetical protein